MIDFNKLNDPAFKEEVQRESQERAAKLKEASARWASAVDFCGQDDRLSDKERSFLSSVKVALSSGRSLSDKQEKWLLDIEARLMPKAYVSVTHGLRGYFAVLIETDEDGCPSPSETGIGSYKKREGAVEEAKSWAQAEGLRFLE